MSDPTAARRQTVNGWRRVGEVRDVFQWMYSIEAHGPTVGFWCALVLRLRQAPNWLARSRIAAYIARMPDWPAAVLFDFDGVLVNSEPLHFFAFHEVLKDLGIELSEDQYYRELIGFDDRGAFAHVFERHGKTLAPPTLLRLLTRKSRILMDLIHRRQYHALDGVEAFVRGIWRDYPLAICSGALREEIEAMLEGISLRDCFGVIVSAEDVTVGKPDPQGYLLTARLLSEKIRRPIEPADCLVVEDAPSVIRSAKAAGFKVLAVTNTYPAEKLDDADWIVESLRPEQVRRQLPQLRMLIS